MKAGWKRVSYKIGEVCRVINGRAYLMPELLDEGKYRILRVGNFFNSDKWYYSDLELDDDKYCYDGDLLFAWSCSFGPKIWHGEKTIYHYHIWKLVENSDLIDRRWLYYWLNCAVAELTAGNHGSVMMHMTKGEMENMSIDLPPLPVQRRIAAVLGALDDKIELNRKMNANLEAQAQALFKSWFVDFEPWGGKMPKEWKMGTLGELVTVCYGKDHKKLADGAIPVFGSGGLMRYAEKALFDQESVLIPRKGSLNNIMYADKPFWTVDTMFYTKMKMKNAAKYVYLFLRGKDMSSLNTGSAVPSMTTDILNAMKVIVPSENGLSEFECKLNPMFKMIAANAAESRKLAETRDALLPKLMSGEVEA